MSGHRARSRVQLLDGDAVRLGQILHVDVVANAGTVGRGPVLSEERQRPATPQRGVNGERDQVRLRIVVLGEFARRVCPCGIEVAQCGIPE